MNDTMIEAKNLKKYFKTRTGMNHAVDDVSFRIMRGETLGVVGESGCGKSTLGRLLIRLLEPTSGQMFFEEHEYTHVKGSELHKVREKIQMIFQDPYSSLNPRFCIEQIVSEPLRLSQKYKKAEIREATERLMDLVGIDRRLWASYPHELDGGRRQRVGIARALALNPQFIVCDEPVSALDVSIQAQVLNLMMDIQEQRDITYMFITHDLSVVRHIANHICVMYLGQMVEKAPTEELFKETLHPYTKALLSAVPTIDLDQPLSLLPMKGEVSSAINPKPGCRFAARCPYATQACLEPQPLVEVKPDHFVACCRVNEL